MAQLLLPSGRRSSTRVKMSHLNYTPINILNKKHKNPQSYTKSA